jgi:hypothetical protein
MTKSTITREESIQAVFDLKVGYRLGFSDIEILKRVARMALSAMHSESECLPLDYLQGHKDGLDWASRLAEANHPETGDWLYDDPIELAKAIRKGPDMPLVQPIADSEPDRNPVLAYADSYRDMAKQGVESVPIWSVITDLERNIAPLYRHAQPADRENDMSRIFAESYQVVGALAEALNIFDDPCVIKALDNLSAQELVHEDVLPFSVDEAAQPAPGKWIPVSERMPENNPGSYEYLVFETLNNRVNHDYWNVPDKGDDEFTPFWNYYGEHVTHWMPMPAAPQETKP